MIISRLRRTLFKNNQRLGEAHPIGLPRQCGGRGGGRQIRRIFHVATRFLFVEEAPERGDRVSKNALSGGVCGGTEGEGGRCRRQRGSRQLGLLVLATFVCFSLLYLSGNPTRGYWNLSNSNKRIIVKPSQPISIISRGCSGSSAMIKFTGELLEAHGMRLSHLNDPELLTPKKNPHWNSSLHKLGLGGETLSRSKKHPQYCEIILDAMNQTIFSTKEERMTLFFKSLGTTHLIANNGTLVYGLKEMGVRFALFYRSNVLDQLVCCVRDCFGCGSGDDAAGHPVFATNGSRTDLCFQRRSSKVKVKAYMNTAVLVKTMRKGERNLQNDIDFLTPLTETGEAFTNEDLFAYEYTQDEDVFDQSRNAWINFLSFVPQVDNTTLTRLMREHQGTLTIKPHSDTIANIDDVIAALKNAKPPLDHYLRY